MTPTLLNRLKMQRLASAVAGRYSCAASVKPTANQVFHGGQTTSERFIATLAPKSTFVAGNSITAGGRKDGIQTTRGVATNQYPLRAFPQYTVFGETCMLTVKVMMPGFRVHNGTTLVLDNNKRGRIVLEWTPRDSDGKPVRDGSIRFALSAEECGLLLDQLPKQQDVELSRRTSNYDAPPGTTFDYANAPEKVLRLTPGEGGTTTFKVDYEKEGVGGQEPGGEIGASGPLEVMVHVGELQVIQSILRDSMPKLIGWTTMMEIAGQHTLASALAGPGSRAAPRYNSGGPGSSDFDF